MYLTTFESRCLLASNEGALPQEPACEAQLYQEVEGTAAWAVGQIASLSMTSMTTMLCLKILEQAPSYREGEGFVIQATTGLNPNDGIVYTTSIVLPVMGTGFLLAAWANSIFAPNEQSSGSIAALVGTLWPVLLSQYMHEAI